MEDGAGGYNRCSVAYNKVEMYRVKEPEPSGE